MTQNTSGKRWRRCYRLWYIYAATWNIRGNFTPLLITWALQANLWHIANWSIIADFQTLRRCCSWQLQLTGFKFHKALVTRCILFSCQKFATFVLFVYSCSGYIRQKAYRYEVTTWKIRLFKGLLPWIKAFSVMTRSNNEWNRKQSYRGR